MGGCSASTEAIAVPRDRTIVGSARFVVVNANMKSRRRFACAAVLAAQWGTWSCEEPHPPASYQFVIRVSSDPGQPLANARVSADTASLGTTGSDGSLLVTMAGNEGQTEVLNVKCPDGFRQPSAPLAVILRRLNERSRLPEYRAECPPKDREVVVVVRAENGPNLPVMYLNQTIARTDASGAAHVAMRLPPQEPFELMLVTTDAEGNAEASRLRPRNPTARFVVLDHDGLYVMDQPFVVDAPKKAAPRRVVRGPSGPVRLKSEAPRR